MIRSPLVRLGLLACVPAFAACADSAVPAVRDIDSLPVLGARERLRIGSVDDPDIGFTSIGAVAVDRDGNVYVLEQSAPEVRVYSPDGELLRRIGRSGDGPGEFRSPYRMGLVGDTLWVNDRSGYRIQLFTREGDVLGTLTPRVDDVEALPGVVVQFAAEALRQDGTVVAAWMLPRPAQPVADSFFVPWLRVDPAGTILDTIALQPIAFSSSKRISLAGRQLPVPRPPSSGKLYVPADDGAWLIERPVATDASGGTLTITHVGSASDTLVHRELQYVPRRISDAYIDELTVDGAQSWARATGLDEDDLRGLVRSELELPEFQPPVSSGMLAQDGSLWLRRDTNGEPVTGWLLVSPFGEPVGTTELPGNAVMLCIDRSNVWVSQRDSLGVPWLVQYELHTEQTPQ